LEDYIGKLEEELAPIRKLQAEVKALPLSWYEKLGKK
jgi:hypothetical protein